MKPPKEKCYVLMVAKTFPHGHPRKGEYTHFLDLIDDAMFDRFLSEEDKQKRSKDLTHKIHTIRKNYPLWEKRIAEVQAGKAYLSLRQWKGRPYHSDQVEFMQLRASDGVGLEEFFKVLAGINMDNIATLDLLAKNDGLSFEDFDKWFEPLPERPCAIIHFTSFRYL